LPAEEQHQRGPEEHSKDVDHDLRHDPTDLERDILGVSIGTAWFGSRDHIDARGQSCIATAATGNPASLTWMPKGFGS
jgi:hypothetical protein